MKWDDGIYGVYSATTKNHLIRLVIEWTDEGYRVCCVGQTKRTLKKRFREIEEAKTAAEVLALRLLKEALEEVEERR